MGCLDMLVGHEQSLGDDFGFEGAASHLKSLEHRSTAVDQDFTFKQANRHGDIANEIA